MDVQSVVRGHNVYKHVWAPVTGEELTVLPEESNIHDSHAVAVMKDDEIVGHVPRELRIQKMEKLRAKLLEGSLIDTGISYLVRLLERKAEF